MGRNVFSKFQNNDLKEYTGPKMTSFATKPYQSVYQTLFAQPVPQPNVVLGRYQENLHARFLTCCIGERPACCPSPSWQALRQLDAAIVSPLDHAQEISPPLRNHDQLHLPFKLVKVQKAN